jgi:hypothetical protein
MAGGGLGKAKPLGPLAEGGREGPAAEVTDRLFAGIETRGQANVLCTVGFYRKGVLVPQFRIHSPSERVDKYVVEADDVRSGGKSGEWLDFVDARSGLILRVATGQVVMVERVDGKKG